MGAPVVAGVGSALILAVCAVSLPPAPGEQQEVLGIAPGFRGAAAADPGSAVWDVFRARTEGGSAAVGQLSKRFRLAGTFLDSGSANGETRKAVLAEAQSGEEFIVGESELTREILVVRIQRESVLLRGPGGEEQLWLSFAAQSFSGTGKDDGSAGGRDGVGAGDLSGLDRFGGKRVGERRWIFKRGAVMSYYRELREDPERLLKVFDSLKPVYTHEGKIDGYRLGAEGESEFFQAVGLKENDIVRSVNTVRMSNRWRAEHFIGEFVQERANAFVIEIERDGATQRLVYQVR
ncbi:MAG: hypothetical protein QME60_07585 [Verrucomicrobiota bacterium]|nr:hypothetical protein [Verrucomicrobiota bacterium]